MLSKFFAAAMLAAVSASPAFAQNTATPVAAAPFTGPHIEGLIGYDNVGGTRDGRDGLLYGIGAGYDFQIGGAVAGIEGEWSDSTARGSTSNLAVIGDSAGLRTDRDLYIGARVGFAVAPSTLLYAKGGYTNARFKTIYTAGGTTTNFGNTLDGYRLGAGVEQKFALFGPSGFVKAEYRYSNYKNLNVGTTNVGVDLDRHQAVLGVGVRF
jgi:outer membrane immunogenic protein